MDSISVPASQPDVRARCLAHKLASPGREVKYNLLIIRASDPDAEVIGIQALSIRPQ